MNNVINRSDSIDFDRYNGLLSINVMSKEELNDERLRLEALYPDWTLKEHKDYALILRRLPHARKAGGRSV